MKYRNKILELIAKRGAITSLDAETAGIPRKYLYALFGEGTLDKSASGMFTLTDQIINEHQNLVEVCNKIPKAVISLMTALSFHDITTQIPTEIWISVPRNTWLPEFEYLTLNSRILTAKPYEFGIQEHKVGDSIVRVYSPAKTVADCFKFRNIVGLDVAIEALKESLRSKKVSIDELTKASQVNRVTNIMRPYMESIA